MAGNVHLSHVTRKFVFGVCEQVRIKPTFSEKEANKNLKILGIASKAKYYARKDTGQTARIRRLICVFVVRIMTKDRFSHDVPHLSLSGNFIGFGGTVTQGHVYQGAKIQIAGRRTWEQMQFGE